MNWLIISAKTKKPQKTDSTHCLLTLANKH